MSTETILEEAARITRGDRQAQYGPPDQDFARTAGMVNVLFADKLAAKITPSDIALLMICLKLSRQTHQQKRDNWVDIAGYAHCGNVCDEVAIAAASAATDVDCGQGFKEVDKPRLKPISEWTFPDWDDMQPIDLSRPCVTRLKKRVDVSIINYRWNYPILATGAKEWSWVVTLAGQYYVNGSIGDHPRDIQNIPEGYEVPNE